MPAIGENGLVAVAAHRIAHRDGGIEEPAISARSRRRGRRTGSDARLANARLLAAVSVQQARLSAECRAGSILPVREDNPKEKGRDMKRSTSGLMAAALLLAFGATSLPAEAATKPYKITLSN